MTTEEKVQQEISPVIDQLKTNLETAKSVAIAEAWKILQLLVAQVVKDIENFAVNWPGSEKKQLALSIISAAYDKLFLVIDIPMIPHILEGYIHGYIKKLLLMLVGSSIDAMVTTFKQIGFFISNNQYKGINKV